MGHPLLEVSGDDPTVARFDVAAPLRKTTGTHCPLTGAPERAAWSTATAGLRGAGAGPRSSRPRRELRGSCTTCFRRGGSAMSHDDDSKQIATAPDGSDGQSEITSARLDRIRTRMLRDLQDFLNEAMPATAERIGRPGAAHDSTGRCESDQPSRSWAFRRYNAPLASLHVGDNRC